MYYYEKANVIDSKYLEWHNIYYATLSIRNQLIYSINIAPVTFFSNNGNYNVLLFIGGAISISESSSKKIEMISNSNEYNVVGEIIDCLPGNYYVIDCGIFLHKEATIGFNDYHIGDFVEIKGSIIAEKFGNLASFKINNTSLDFVAGDYKNNTRTFNALAYSGLPYIVPSILDKGNSREKMVFNDDYDTVCVCGEIIDIFSVNKVVDNKIVETIIYIVDCSFYIAIEHFEYHNYTIGDYVIAHGNLFYRFINGNQINSQSTNFNINNLKVCEKYGSILSMLYFKEQKKSDYNSKLIKNINNNGYVAYSKYAFYKICGEVIDIVEYNKLQNLYNSKVNESIADYIYDQSGQVFIIDCGFPLAVFNSSIKEVTKGDYIESIGQIWLLKS